MSKEEVKNVPSSVSKECWKKLKIVAIQKDITLPQLVREILERFTATKKVESLGEVKEFGFAAL